MPTALTADSDFAQYCCELLAAIATCHALRMFGGLGIRTADGLNVALVTDLGEGDTLWLKADAQARADFEAAGCQRFVYTAKGKPMAMNYYTAPEDALDAAHAMAPWARLALESALKARKPVAKRPLSAPKTKAKPAADGPRAVAPRKKPGRG